MFRSTYSNRSVISSATPVRLNPSVDISFTALVYFGATLFIGVAAMNSQTNLLFGVFGLMMGVLIVAGYISRFSLKKLDIRRALPDQLVVGQQATIVYSVANRKRFWPSISVAVGEIDGCEAFNRQPYAYLMHVAARFSTQLIVQFQPKRRGVHNLESYQISTSFPFGFIRRAAVCRQKDTIVVLPAIAKVDPHFLSMCMSAETSGSHMRPHRGGHDEFYGVKEYRGGENPRLIHWKRSARTGTLVVREMSRIALPRLLILVDTMRDRREDNPPTRAEIEKVIAMVASAASFALDRGYAVGLCVWSGDWIFIPPNGGKHHRRDLLSILAKLPANPRADMLAGMDVVFPRLEHGTTLVILTARATPSNIAPRHRGHIIVLSSIDPTVNGLFLFPPTVLFDHCMPVDQDSPGSSSTRRRNHESPSRV